MIKLFNFEQSLNAFSAKQVSVVGRDTVVALEIYSNVYAYEYLASEISELNNTELTEDIYILLPQEKYEYSLEEAVSGMKIALVKELYEKATCTKEYKEYKDGCHAEDLFLHYEEDFSKLCTDWLLK